MNRYRKIDRFTTLYSNNSHTITDGKRGTDAPTKMQNR